MSNEQSPSEGAAPKENKPGEVPEEEEEKIIVFQFNDSIGDFEELEIEEGVPLHELLDSDFILLFIDPKHYRVYVWQGSNTTTRMKFISAKLAPNIRDKYGIAYKVTSVDEGNETMGFKILVGLEKEIDYVEEQKGPTYEGKKEDIELLEVLSREKILLILEKTGVPEGYERKMVIVKNTLYGYKEYERNYMGTVIKEKQLFPLKEEVPDGPYLVDNYFPRMLLSFNNVILTELLQKKENKNN